MSQVSAFRPDLQDGTSNIAVTAVNQVIVPAPDANQNEVAFRIANIGTQVIFILVAARGQPSPVATVANGIPILANTVETLTLPPNPQIGVIAGATGSTMYVTPGEGV